MLDQTCLARWHAIADLGVDLGSGAFEGAQLIELGDGGGVLDPVKQLFAGYDPY